MYSSPAYGTHHAFSKPEMDHLRESVDNLVKERTTKVQDISTSPDQIDTEDMLSASEVIGHNVDKQNEEEYTNKQGIENKCYVENDG